MIRSRAAAGAGQFRSHMIAGIGVEPLLQRAGGYPQSLPPRRHLYRCEIQFRARWATYEPLAFLDDLVLEIRWEPPFSASWAEAVAEPSNSRSAQSSQPSQ